MSGGLHALIVGVGDYPHLEGGSGEPAAGSYGMAQLTSAVPAASSVGQWLHANRSKLVKDLASCRMLSSPTLDDFRRAALEWRDDCATDPDNTALFYFSGHGLERSRSDAVLLMSDFGDMPGNPLVKATDVNNLFYGMAPTAQRPRMARTQLWFVDACRGFPKEFEDFETLSASDVFDIVRPDVDDRCAPTYFSAIPGTAAYGIPHAGTAFSAALLASLDGAAARSTADGWAVAVDGLFRALEVEVAAGPVADGQQVWMSGQLRDAVARTIARVDGVPRVRVKLGLSRASEDAGLRPAIAPLGGQPLSFPHPLRPNPHLCSWPAGAYEFGLSPSNGVAPTPELVQPPEFERVL